MRPGPNLWKLISILIAKEAIPENYGTVEHGIAYFTNPLKRVKCTRAGIRKAQWMVREARKSPECKRLGLSTSEEIAGYLLEKMEECPKESE